MYHFAKRGMKVGCLLAWSDEYFYPSSLPLPLTLQMAFQASGCQRETCTQLLDLHGSMHAINCHAEMSSPRSLPCICT